MNKPAAESLRQLGGLPFFAANWNPFGAATGQFGDWVRSAGRLQSEVLNFAQARFRRDIEALERFARCRKAEDYVDAQAAFIAEVCSDYAKESLRIADILGEAAQSAKEKFAETGADAKASRAA